MWSAISSVVWGSTTEEETKVKEERPKTPKKKVEEGTIRGSLFQSSSSGYNCLFQKCVLRVSRNPGGLALHAHRREEVFDEDDETDLYFELRTAALRTSAGHLSDFGIAWQGNSKKWILDVDVEQEASAFVEMAMSKMESSATPKIELEVSTPSPTVVSITPPPERKPEVAPTSVPTVVSITPPPERKPEVAPTPAPTVVSIIPPPERKPNVTKTTTTTEPTTTSQEELESPSKISGDILFTAEGTFSVIIEENEVILGTDIQLQVLEIDDYEYGVVFIHSEEQIHNWDIRNSSLRWEEDNNAITWSADMDGLKPFLFTFSERRDFKSFMQKHISLSFQAKMRTPFKVAKEDEDWISRTLTQQFQTMRLDEDEEDDEVEEEEEEEYELDAPKPVAFNTPTKNSLLSVGRYSSNSYVVRGNQVGIFSPSKQSSSTSMKFQTMTDPITTTSTKTPFSPSHAMLHQRDEKLLFLHPENKKKVFCMDIERGKVVEEWETSGFNTSKILPETKDAQQQGRNTFLGINNAGFFVMDPRQRDKVVRSYQYKNASTANFSCAATTADGHMAVGTKLGDIRLFSASSVKKGGGTDYINATAPRAKTKLLGFGDPILGIDVTRDGRFVLATCYNYLILSPVQEGNASGFTKSVKKAPMLLRLADKDSIRIGENFTFTPAKFNIVGEETFVVTSAKNWLISWDLSEIVKEDFSHIPSTTTLPYFMKQLPDVVVADDFSAQKETDVVFALPDDVRHYEWRGKGRGRKEK